MTAAALRRPQPAQRRAVMLQAAADVFFEQGYAATSIDMIIDRIGGSKRNIYNEFGSKEGLFTALVTEITDSVLAAFSTEDAGHQTLKTTLLQVARRLMAIYMSTNLIGVYRTILTEAFRFPHLAQEFYEKGPGRAAAKLREVLDAATVKGEIDTPDTKVAADHFVGMIRDNLHLQVVLGLRAPPTVDEVETAVTTAVEIFLNGICFRSGHSEQSR